MNKEERILKFILSLSLLASFVRMLLGHFENFSECLVSLFMIALGAYGGYSMWEDFIDKKD